MDEEISSVVINIPKRRVFVIQDNKSSKSYLRKLQTKLVVRRNIPSQVSLNNSLPGDKPIKAKVLENDSLLLSFKEFLRAQNLARLKLRRSMHVHQINKVKGTNVLKCKDSGIKVPFDDVHTITDVDKDFFDDVNGRPLKQTTRIPLYKTSKYIINAQLRIRHAIGFKNDCVQKIELAYKREQDIYEQSVKNCQMQAKYFDKFISEDYLKSLAFLEKWERIKVKLNGKIVELHNIAADGFYTQSKLVGISYKFKLLQKYGRFLYYMSPAAWRSHNKEFAQSTEIQAKGFDLGSPEDDTFTDMFEDMQKECFSKRVKPALYFTNPSDLVKTFETIELQQQYVFRHAANMRQYKTSFQRGIKHLKALLAVDSTSVASLIKGLESVVRFHEERASELQARFFKILFGSFYQDVGALDILKLKSDLQFCYEKVFAEKPTTMNIVDMAKHLELYYVDYITRIESLRDDRVKEAVQECMKSERIKMKKAKLATRQLRDFNRLQKELHRAFQPSVKHRVPYLTIRKPSVPFQRKNIKAGVGHQEKTSKRELTEEEREYLTLLTDWMEHEDPAKYLQSSIIET